MTQTTLATVLTGVDTLAWLDEQGAGFCRVKAGDKQPFEGGWQQRPLTLDGVIPHLHVGGNVGVLGGVGDLYLIDVDGTDDGRLGYSEFVSFFQNLANAPYIKRDGADKGKIIVRVTNQVLPATARKEDRARSPYFELIAAGKQGVVAGTHPTGVPYELHNADQEIPTLLAETVDAYVEIWTGRPLFETITPADLPPRNGKQHNGDGLREKVLAAWSTVDIFAHFGYAGSIRKERGELRLLKNGGLLVRLDTNKWYCHSEQVGGYQFEAWCYCTRGNTDVPKGAGFLALLDEMAQAAGIPDRSLKTILLAPMAQQNGKTNETRNKPAEGQDTLASLLTAPADHAGHADCFVAHSPHKFLYSDKTGWLYYTGTHYEREQADERLTAAIIELLREREAAAWKAEKVDLARACRASSNNFAGIKTALKSRVSIALAELDARADLLNCKNGVLNLRTKELTPHDPSQRFTYVVPVNYNPSADRSMCLTFLGQAVAAPELVDYLQLAAGYSITGETWEEIMFYLWGPSRSGKGTFCETIMAMLGGSPLAFETGMDTFTRKPEANSQNFDLAPLRPARFVAASESEQGRRLNAARLKRLTGRNLVHCAYKGHDSFNYMPLYKIWLSSNFPVNTDGNDDAVWGRVRVIEFPNTHLGKEDITLKAKLTTPEALEGWLAWAVDGAATWYDHYDHGRRMPTPQRVIDATRAHREMVDYTGQFLEEEYDLVPDGQESRDSVLGRYADWCKENHIEPQSARTFNDYLRSKGVSCNVSIRTPSGGVTKGYKGMKRKDW